MLASGVYHLESPQSWKKDVWWDGTPFYHRSVPLQRNVMADIGSVSIGYTFIKGNLFISFTGTRSAEYWLYNLDTGVSDLKIGRHNYQFHNGLYHLALEVYNHLSEETFSIPDAPKNVFWVGHSAAGAVAGINALLFDSLQWLNMKASHYIIDFGTPKYITSRSDTPSIPRLRFQNIYDLVPCVPLTWRGPLVGYRHFGDVLWTTPTHDVIQTPPWYRIPLMVWRYARSVTTMTPISEIVTHHTISHYNTAVMGHYFLE